MIKICSDQNNLWWDVKNLCCFWFRWHTEVGRYPQICPKTSNQNYMDFDVSWFMYLWSRPIQCILSKLPLWGGLMLHSGMRKGFLFLIHKSFFGVKCVYIGQIGTEWNVSFLPTTLLAARKCLDLFLSSTWVTKTIYLEKKKGSRENQLWRINKAFCIRVSAYLKVGYKQHYLSSFCSLERQVAKLFLWNVSGWDKIYLGHALNVETRSHDLLFSPWMWKCSLELSDRVTLRSNVQRLFLFQTCINNLEFVESNELQNEII